MRNYTCWLSGSSTPPGTPVTYSQQYLVSQGRNIVYPPQFGIVVFIIVNSVLTVHIIWRISWRKNASKCTDFHVTIQNFSGDYAPVAPCWRGPTAPLFKPHPLCTPALRSSSASLWTSLVPRMFVSRWCNCWSLVVFRFGDKTLQSQVSISTKCNLPERHLHLI